MKKLFYLIVVMSGFAFLLSSCSGSDNSMQSIASDDVIAANLWNRLMSEEYSNTAKTWNLWPGKTGYYAGDTNLMGRDPHMGPQVFRTFVNPTALSNLNSKSFPLADNAVIVKENYMVSGSDTTLAALTVMLKVSGYDSEHGDWFWVSYQPDGTVKTMGKVDMCYGCHAGANNHYGFDRDYVWTDLP